MIAADTATDRRTDIPAYVEPALELLGTLAHALDLRRVFPRVSAIAQRMLPHDTLAVAAVGADGEVLCQASSADDVPAVTLPPEVLIAHDLAREGALPSVGPAARARLVAAGYRSWLGVRTQRSDAQVTLGFWAKRPHAFGEGDIPVARLIAEHLSVAVAHEQLAQAACRQAAARVRPTPGADGARRLAAGPLGAGHGRIVGASAAWQDVLKKATQVAATEATVLLCGESGTGKEVVARFIHQASARRARPFVALNCAALPEQLLESELFGYERGAFTSAQQAKPGQIELAAGGVLFLDEVSEMSLAAQAKFLRVLQEREFQRLGGTRPLKAAIRVIAAANRDLRQAVEDGTFRADLYYRLQVFDIRLAPLRDRRADILPLSAAFLDEIAASLGRPPAALTAAARDALLAHPWPGNVRELRNALERAAIVCEDATIDAADLALQPVRRPLASGTTDLGTVERELIAQVLRACRGNKSRAAQRLGLSRTQLYVRLRKYDLDQPALA